MAEDGSTNNTNITFTEGESKLVLSIMSHLTSEIQFDADAVAAELGYKAGNIVKTRWGQIKRNKLSSVASSGGIKKRTPKKKDASKQAGEDGVGDGDDGEEMKTPSKTPTKRGKKPKGEKVNEEEPTVKQENGEEDAE